MASCSGFSVTSPVVHLTALAEKRAQVVMFFLFFNNLGRYRSG